MDTYDDDIETISDFNSDSSDSFSEISDADDYADNYDYNSDSNLKSISDMDIANDKDKLVKLMNTEYVHPDTNDKDFQEKIYKKKEYYSHKIPNRRKLNNYDDIEKYRQSICNPSSFSLLPQQAFLSNYINPDTPYRGVVVMHGTGVGKCVLPDQYIYINGSIVKIQDFFDKNYNNGRILNSTNNIQGMKINSNETWVLPKNNYYINSFDTVNNKIKLEKVEKLYRQQINENVIEIKLENGLIINQTMQHKLYTIDKLWSNWLKVGDFVGLPKYLYNSYRMTDKTDSDIKLDDSNNNIESILDHMLNQSSDIINKFLVKFFGLNDSIQMENRICLYKLYHLLKLIYNSPTIDISNLTITLNCKLDKKSYIKSDTIKDPIEYVKIISIRQYNYTGYVYDLEISPTHNYIVNSILTHNTCAGIAIAEKFKPMVQKYGTKIYILVPGPIIKENWKEDILKCTGETYLKQMDSTIYTNETDLQKQRKNAINNILQFYRFMSYRSFYKKVLGEKIHERVSNDDDTKVVVKYRKTEDGEFERDIAIDRIYNLNNTLIIVDEAHSLTGNLPVRKIMKWTLNQEVKNI